MVMMESQVRPLQVSVSSSLKVSRSCLCWLGPPDWEMPRKTAEPATPQMTRLPREQMEMVS